MYYVNRSTSGQLADAAAYASSGRCVSTHQVAAFFCMTWRHVRHL